MAWRVRQAQAEALSEALTYIPDRFADHIGADLWCTDPIFAGICRPPWDNEFTSDGRSYRTTAHVLYPYHAKDLRCAVVLPTPEEPDIIVHEFGHVLHWHLQERAGGWDAVPRLDVVSDYAATNSREEFAEAFTLWCWCRPERAGTKALYWRGWSQRNAEFFERLLCE